jgi:hypothetical protein
MPGTEIAQYGIGFFALALLFYFLTNYFKTRNNSDMVIQNNTKALEKLNTLIQVQLATLDAKIDELLRRNIK